MSHLARVMHACLEAVYELVPYDRDEFGVTIRMKIRGREVRSTVQARMTGDPVRDAEAMFSAIDRAIRESTEKFDAEQPG